MAFSSEDGDQEDEQDFASHRSKPTLVVADVDGITEEAAEEIDMKNELKQARE
jgi:hypothetical protein